MASALLKLIKTSELVSVLASHAFFFSFSRLFEQTLYVGYSADFNESFNWVSFLVCLLRSVLRLNVLFGCRPGLCDFGEVL